VEQDNVLYVRVMMFLVVCMIYMMQFTKLKCPFLWPFCSLLHYSTYLKMFATIKTQFV